MTSRPSRRLRCAFAAALLIGIAAALSSAGQSELPPDDSRRDFVLDLPAGPPLTGDALVRRTEEVADTVRCPQCQGLSVADSPSPTALAMKAEVREMLAEGYSEEQILSYFEASYGEFIRLSPKVEGFNLVVWIAPFLAIAFGLVVVMLRLRATGTVVAALPDADEAPSTDADTSIEDDDLAAYREQVRREIAS